MGKMSTESLLHAVKAHAYRNYDKGWDVLVECHTDQEIKDAIGKSTTEKGAIKATDRRLGITIRYEYSQEV